MASHIYLWNKAPALRLLLPLAGGILLERYHPLPDVILLLLFFILLITVIFYHFSSIEKRFQSRIINGLCFSFLFFIAGALITIKNDIRKHPQWMGIQKLEKAFILLRLEEPLIEKENSYKALASVKHVYYNGHLEKLKGKVILYFKKDSFLKKPGYGSQLLVRKQLQEIKNAGNPGSFDYKRYNLFHHISHQVYITNSDYQTLLETDKNFFEDFIFRSRSFIISILRKYIDGEKERGLAEALLIGYKDDLDKNLVQAYSNTGVVHIIAISGLHLGIIYWLLLRLTKPLKGRKLFWTRFFVITGVLWLFSFLVGAQPSVLRSAVMFTCIAGGTVLDRKTSIYNTLAFSALVLLCWNPFWLWDVGFQLSYAAVLSIIIFFRPVYNWFYSPNKILDFFWKLLAASLAAQLLTLPISIFHFHQFPVLFLLTNLIAVPLSSGILIAEIILCISSIIPAVANILGRLIEWLIYIMNSCIENLDQVAFSVWDGMSISVLQSILLLVLISSLSYWLLEKERKALWINLGCMTLFFVLRSVSFIETSLQKKLIVYNVPKHQAIDIMNGRRNYFIGDDALRQNEFLYNFHIKPSRLLHRIRENIPLKAHSLKVADKRILIIDTTILFKSMMPRVNIDLIILSRNPRVYINKILKSFKVEQIILDGSVPSWKARLWKKDCDSLKIPCHDVTEKGAFVINF